MTKVEIAKILKQLRVDSGLTQKQVAEAIGSKQQTVASWEIGQSQPDANTLFVLCRKYGTTVDRAFGFSDKKSIDLPDQIVDYFNRIDEEGQQLIKTLIVHEHDRCVMYDQARLDADMKRVEAEKQKEGNSRAGSKIG